FVSLGCLPELWPKLLLFNQRHHCMIGPMTMTAAAATEQTILRSKDG
ncbi:unnamed protein product, partial [Adineta steineri]